MIIGDNFFEGLQVVFGTMTVWSEVSSSRMTFMLVRSLLDIQYLQLYNDFYSESYNVSIVDDYTSCYKSYGSSQTYSWCGRGYLVIQK